MRVAPYVVEEYVRWSDVDFAGIIFYGSYVRFFEIAETELFRAAGLPHREFFDKFDIWLPRKAVHAEFFRPARLDDRLRVAAYVARLRGGPAAGRPAARRGGPAGRGLGPVRGGGDGAALRRRPWRRAGGRAARQRPARVAAIPRLPHGWFLFLVDARRHGGPSRG